jgi:hypothetical protein
MHVRIRLATLCCALILNVAHAADDIKLTGGERLPILGWVGIPEAESTVERYREMAEAGFTHSWYAWYSNADAVQKTLDAAKEAGIKVVAGCPEVKEKPEQFAKRFSKHPAFFGYCLRDEPSAADFGELSAWAQRIRAVDKEHWTYVNLLPTYATPQQLGTATYQEHVERFFAEFPVQIMTFDHYPGMHKAYDTNWYDNLAIISKTCEKAKKPFWGFVLSCSAAGFDPTPATMRLEAYTNLAFGAQGIQYFTYWYADDPGCPLSNHPMTKEGKRGANYEVVKALNQDLIALSPIFVKSKVTQLGTVNATISGTQPYKARAPISEVKADGKGALVAVHANHKREFLIVINRNPAAAMNLDVLFDGKKKISSVDKRGVLHPISDKAVKQPVDAGDVAIYCWDAP